MNSLVYASMNSASDWRLRATPIPMDSMAQNVPPLLNYSYYAGTLLGAVVVYYLWRRLFMWLWDKNQRGEAANPYIRAIATNYLALMSGSIVYSYSNNRSGEESLLIYILPQIAFLVFDVRKIRKSLKNAQERPKEKVTTALIRLGNVVYWFCNLVSATLLAVEAFTKSGTPLLCAVGIWSFARAAKYIFVGK